jgi:L-iditol 2-dehydrogenase
VTERGTAVVEVARLHAPRDVRVQREPAVRPAKGEVRLRVAAVGLCGSDIRWYEEGAIGHARLQRPLVLGHEFAGVIEDGPDAGLRVVADPAVACLACEQCAAGWPNLCQTSSFAGHGATDGALRSAMTWPRTALHPLPDTIPDAEATLLEPLGVALHASDLGRPTLGGSAGVFGCGPLGLLLIQVLRAAGASTVVATDPLAHRRSAAATAGATEVREPNGKMGDHSLTDVPVDVAFEVAGDDGALADAIAAVRPGGRVVLVGIPSGDTTTFAAGLARRKGISMLLCRRMQPADLPRAIALAAAGSIDLTRLISERFPLNGASQAFAALAARRGLKVVVTPGAGPA